MFAYAPERLRRNAPLVIALHGCTQTAEEYDHGTGWSSLADTLGFAVVCPQQQPTNNPKNCFSWFLRVDTMRGHGEALSIREMVDYAIAKYGTDRSKVFVTGLSAGGAMASVMLATYPESFAGGAIIAGLPYGCASNVQQAFEAMFSNERHGVQVLGERVRSSSGHRGPWPKISIWHGTSDSIVNPSNSEDIIRQWADVHGVSDRPSHQKFIDGHTLRVWTGPNGEPLIEAFSVSDMGHGVPLATTGRESCGAPGAFFLDAGISSTHQIARFWGLDESVDEIPYATQWVDTPVEIQPQACTLFTTEAAAEASRSSARASLKKGVEDKQPERLNRLDPNTVIAAAFEAAGLRIPEVPTARPDLPARVSPGPIIAAAFKAAGIELKAPLSRAIE